ncbi:hypothetical protein E2562_022474 [Oryza meyeriana var. granulata]|uniref:Uncharacterized protein n=1 Tax=Oryza meyeriana var. granulata TaxID=110450 RepID=A0A6G1BN06_9ORYZ|nr:hypothetical protein E2562_022474 [Oryza meyeriana var. granulata]
MWSGKRGHNARTQARNSRGQIAHASEVYYVDSDSDIDVVADPAAIRVALEVRTIGAKRGKGAASSGGKKKVPVSSAKKGRRALSTSSKKKVRAIFSSELGYRGLGSFDRSEFFEDYHLPEPVAKEKLKSIIDQAKADCNGSIDHRAHEFVTESKRDVEKRFDKLYQAIKNYRPKN